MTFLHGVETFELAAGPRPIQQVRSAVIGLVGTAAVHHATSPATLNEAELVLSDRDNAQFGPAIDGYTIPAALKAIQDQGYGTVLVVNVFDPTVHKTDVAEADLDIVAGVITLTNDDVISAVVKVAGGTGDPLIEGTDYSIDRVAGTITVLAGGALAAAVEANVAYTYADPSAVDSADIIGTTTEGVRSGAQAWLDCASRFGFGPKILIAPGFSSSEAVVAALQVLAQAAKLRAVALADVAVGSTLTEVLEGRAPDGEIDLTASDQRVFYCYPGVKVYDAATDSTKVDAFSSRLAGVIARTDSTRGYWHSPSNKQILGVTGIETPLTAAVNDTACEVNQLNAAGVVTIFTGYGAGVRVWGNRSSAFPSSSDIRTFMAVRRTVDVVDESIELAALEFLDGPITQVLIDAILASVNEFLRTLVTRGALAPGSRVEYFPEDNPPSEIAAGHVTFTKTFCPPPPLERLTYKSMLDTTLLGS